MRLLPEQQDERCPNPAAPTTPTALLHPTRKFSDSALVGRWRSEGPVVGEVPVPITGTDIYEWLPGGFFLLHHVDVVIGEQAVRAIELIGEYDPAGCC